MSKHFHFHFLVVTSEIALKNVIIEHEKMLAYILNNFAVVVRNRFVKKIRKNGFSSDPSLPIVTYVLKALPRLRTQGQGLNPQRGLNI